MAVAPLDGTQRLPEEIMTQIFSYLREKDLALCARVKRQWQGYVDQGPLWEAIVKRLVPGLAPLNSKGFLRAFSLQQLRSNDQIVDRVQAFVDGIRLGENGRLRISLGAGAQFQDQVMSLEIKGSKERVSPLLHVDGNYVNDVNDFHVTEYAQATQLISESPLTTPSPPQCSLKTYICHKISHEGSTDIVAVHPKHRCFQAVLRFPSACEPFDLHFRVTEIMMRKVEDLADELELPRKAFYMTAAGVGFLGLYTLSL